MKIVSKRHKDFKPVVLNKIIMPVIRRVVPGLIASELVKVQPMSEPTGLIFATHTFGLPLEKLPKQKTIIKSKRHPDRIVENMWQEAAKAAHDGFISRKYLRDLGGFTDEDMKSAVKAMDEDFDTLANLRVPSPYYVDSVQYNSSTIPYQHL